MTLRNGELLNNRYLIKQVVAARGDTVIYRAFDQTANIEVGIKECRTGSPESWQNCLNEIALMSNLRHPNLMQITDSIEITGQAVYLVTDFVDGKKIFDPAIYPEGMPAREAVPIILAVCDVISYLHHHQPPVSHGEISLDTINLSLDGQVILILPGWMLESTFSVLEINPKSRKTLTNPQVDIADLALVLLQLLTSQIIKGTARELTPDQLQKSLGKVNSPIPEGIAMVLDKALNPDLSQCFQQIEDFRTALLNAVIFMPPAPVVQQTPATISSNDSEVNEIEPETHELRESSIQPEPQSMPKTPIRRRVPWGLLILGSTIGAALLFYLTLTT